MWFCNSCISLSPSGCGSLRWGVSHTGSPSPFSSILGNIFLSNAKTNFQATLYYCLQLDADNYVFIKLCLIRNGYCMLLRSLQSGHFWGTVYKPIYNEMQIQCKQICRWKHYQHFWAISSATRPIQCNNSLTTGWLLSIRIQASSRPPAAEEERIG